MANNGDLGVDGKTHAWPAGQREQPCASIITLIVRLCCCTSVLYTVQITSSDEARLWSGTQKVRYRDMQALKSDAKRARRDESTKRDTETPWTWSCWLGSKLLSERSTIGLYSSLLGTRKVIDLRRSVESATASSRTIMKKSSPEVNVLMYSRFSSEWRQ